MADNKFAKYKQNKFAKYGTPKKGEEPPVQAAPAQQSQPYPSQPQGMDAAMSKAKGLTFGDLGKFADDNVRMLANGATFGFGDKIAAGVDAGLGQGDYTSNLAANRAQTDVSRENAGTLGAISEIGGSMLMPAGLLKAGATATRIPGAVGKYGGMALDGLGLGALNAAGNDQNILMGGLTGLLGGAAGQTAVGTAQKIMGMFNKKPTVPTYDAIKKEASTAYDAARDEKVIYSNPAAKRLLSSIEGDFANRTFEPIAQPGAATALKVLSDRVSSGNPMTREGFDAIRSIAGEQFMPGKASNNALLNIIKGKIDDFQMNPQQGDVLAGDAVKAATLKKQADAAYSQQKKIETIRNAAQIAESRAARTGSGGNGENTLKQELAKIIDNPKKGRGFTADEKSAVEDLIYNQTGRDALRVISKLSPLRHGGAAAVGLGGAMLEPITAGTAMTAGVIAKLLGGKIQAGKLKNVERLIAGGSKAAITPKQNAAQKAIESNRDIIARMLMMGGVTSAGTNN